MAQLGDLNQFIPNWSVGSILGFVGWILLFCLIVGGTIFGIWFFIRSKKFKYKIVIWDNISGVWVPKSKDRGMQVKLGTAGDVILYVLKNNKRLPMPELQAGLNTYYFYIRKDGEWINFVMDDLDELAHKMGAKFLDKEMRYARVQLQRAFNERHEPKKNWLAENASLIFNVVAFTLMGVFLWLIVREIPAIIDRMGPVLDSAIKLTEKQDAIISKMDNLCSGGSGMIKAIIPLFIFWRKE